MAGSLLAAFVAEVTLITYRQYSQGGVAGGGINVPGSAPMNLPLPASYTAPIIAFGALALVPPSGQSFAGLVGWGLVLATVLNLFPGARSTVTLTPPGGQPTQYSAGPGGTIQYSTPAGPPAPTGR